MIGQIYEGLKHLRAKGNKKHFKLSHPSPMQAARPGRKHGPRDRASLFSSRKGKQRESIEKKHYKLHASRLLVPTISAIGPVVHVAAKTVNYGQSCFAFRMKQRK
jgi:hypothetical protein